MRSYLADLVPLLQKPFTRTKRKDTPGSVARYSVHEHIEGVTEQVARCRETEARARFLASENPELRKNYIRQANYWANLAADIEREYYVKDH